MFRAGRGGDHTMTVPRFVTRIRGMNMVLDKNDLPQTVWPPGGTYPWGHAAGTVDIGSTDGGDTQDVLVSGLDPAGDLALETVAVGATSTGVFQHVIGLAVESTDTNAGTVSATIGGTVVAVIAPGESRSAQAVYKLPNRPSRFAAHINEWSATVAGAQKINGALDLALMTRAPGGPWAVRDRLSVHTHGGRTNVAATMFAPLEPGTEIEVAVDGMSDPMMAVYAGFTIAHHSVTPNIAKDSQPFAGSFGSRR